jgi:predicted Zn-dependent protease
VGATDGNCINIEIFEERPPEEVARSASERALKMLSARKVPGGTMPVILASSAGGTMIHEAVGHGLEADHIQEGTSVFMDKIGKRVASGLITVLDDATIPGKRGSFTFDDEGVPAQKTVLIENGILKGYIHSLLTSMKDDASPTGNGRRESYHHRPIPRMSNILILPGQSSVQRRGDSQRDQTGSDPVSSLAGQQSRASVAGGAGHNQGGAEGALACCAPDVYAFSVEYHDVAVHTL